MAIFVLIASGFAERLGKLSAIISSDAHVYEDITTSTPRYILVKFLKAKQSEPLKSNPREKGSIPFSGTTV